MNEGEKNNPTQPGLSSDEDTGDVSTGNTDTKDVPNPELKTRKPRRKTNRRKLFKKAKEKGKHKKVSIHTESTSTKLPESASTSMVEPTSTSLSEATATCMLESASAHMQQSIFTSLPESTATCLPEIGIDDLDLIECVIPDEEERFAFLKQLQKLSAEAEGESQSEDETLMSPEVPVEEWQHVMSPSMHHSQPTMSTSKLTSSVGTSEGEVTSVSMDKSESNIATASSSRPSCVGNVLHEHDYFSTAHVPETVEQSPAEAESIGSLEGETFPEEEHRSNPAPPLASVFSSESGTEDIEVPSTVLHDTLELCKVLLPKPWIVIADNVGLHVLFLSSVFPKAIQREVFLLFNGDIKIGVHGAHLSFADELIKSTASSPIKLTEESIQNFCDRGVSVIKKMMQYNICVGANNLETQCLWERYVNCYVDKNIFKEENYSVTCRSLACPKLVLNEFGTIRCESCNALLKHLRRRMKVAVSDEFNPSTPNIFLSHRQALRKLEMQHNDIRKKDKKIEYLNHKIEILLENEGVDLEEDISTDLEDILSNSALSESQKMFLEQQLRCSQKKDSRAHRWHPSLIRLALYLKMVSSTAYEALRDSGVIKLPCARTLYDYSHAFAPQVGVSDGILKIISEKISKFRKVHQKYVAVLIDEMHVSKNLVYGPDGSLMGYTHLEMVEKEMREFENYLNAPSKHQRTPLASTVLAFMVRGLTSDVKYVVAVYPCSQLKKDMLYSRAWEVIGRLECVGVKVLCVVTDGSTVNRAFIEMHTPVTKLPSGVIFNTINFCSPDRHVLYFVADVAHLIKTVRNCFYNSGDTGKKTRCMEINGMPIVWKTIVRLYLTYQSCNFRKSYKLNARNVFPNPYSSMKVRDAAVVLSETVALDIESQKWPNTEETVRFIRIFNKFFDCLNSKDTFEHIRKRNPNLAPFTNINDERFKWLDSEFLTYLKNWEKQVEAMKINPVERSKKLLSYQTRQGLEMAVKGIIGATTFLLEQGADFVLGRSFSNDPLEQHFSRQRAAGGGSSNPNFSEFANREVSLSIQRTLGIRRRRANVEDTHVGLEVSNDPLPKRRKSSVRKV